MRLETYSPIGNEVLFKEVREEKTASGIFIPGADFILKEEHNFWESSKVVYDGSKSKLGLYKVVKVGESCKLIQPNDTILIRNGVSPEEVNLPEGTFFQVNSAYIIGFNREKE